MVVPWLHTAQKFLHHTLAPLGHCEELVERKRGVSDSVVHFLKTKLKVFLFVKDLIIPLHDANHSSFIVMNTDQLLHYDPLIIQNGFPSAMVHQFFTKIWAVKQGPVTQKVAWKRATTTNNWVWPVGPQ